MATFSSQPGHGFFDKIASRAEKVNSLLMVGLDPHSSELGEGKINAAGAKAFCLRIIEATSAVAVAYKPNAAFFEAFGVSETMRGRSVAKVAEACCMFTYSSMLRTSDQSTGSSDCWHTRAYMFSMCFGTGKTLPDAQFICAYSVAASIGNAAVQQ